LAKEYLKDTPYTLIDAEDNPNLSMEYNILQAPTLLEVSKGVVNKYTNASNIKKYVDAQSLRLQ
jgi:ribonucleoside-triphosphate reductase